MQSEVQTIMNVLQEHIYIFQPVFMGDGENQLHLDKRTQSRILSYSRVIPFPRRTITRANT